MYMLEQGGKMLVQLFVSHTEKPFVEERSRVRPGEYARRIARDDRLSA